MRRTLTTNYIILTACWKVVYMTWKIHIADQSVLRITLFPPPGIGKEPWASFPESSLFVTYFYVYTVVGGHSHDREWPWWYGTRNITYLLGFIYSHSISTRVRRDCIAVGFTITYVVPITTNVNLNPTQVKCSRCNFMW